jgi:hypothetical protein
MNLKLLSYESYPDDQYTAAIATVMYNDELVLTYAQKRKKDGGLFWCSASTAVTKDSEKSNIKSFYFDSNFKMDMFDRFIREQVKALSGTSSASLAADLQRATSALNSPGGEPEQGLPF